MEFLNVDDFCPNTTYGDSVNSEGCSAFQREIPMVMATTMPSISAHFLQQIMTMTEMDAAMRKILMTTMMDITTRMMHALRG